MIPDGWRQTKLGEVVAEFRGGGTPSRKEPSFWGGEIPWASVKDLSSGQLKRTFESITEAGLKNSSASTVPAGTVVLATRMAVGRAVTAEIGLAINQDLKGVLPASELLPSYLKLWLNWNELKIAALASGTTVKGIRLTSLSSLPLQLPPLPEQRKIATILSSVDNAITATRRVIEQNQRMKQGLLQTLMTRGIGHTRFKETEIGEIPEGWEVASLRDLGVWTSGTTPSKSEKSYWGGSVPWVTPKDMKVSIIRSSQDRITDEAVSAGARLLEAGSVLVVVRGMILAHTFPVAVTEVPVTINQDMKALVPNGRINVSFLLSWLQLCEKDMLARVSEATHGTKRLPLVELLSFPVPLPPRGEQEEIAQKFAAWRRQLQNQYHSMKQLQQLKRGLMRDLLTGRVRVPLD